MELFLFIIKDRPGYRRTLHEAQACLEDHLYDKGYDDVRWGDEGDEQYGAWLWAPQGLSSDPYEPATWSEQIIWAVNVPDPEPKTPAVDPLFPVGAEMVMTVKTLTGSHQIVECVTEDVWNEERIRPHIVTQFAVRAGQTLADNWTTKEPT